MEQSVDALSRSSTTLDCLSRMLALVRDQSLSEREISQAIARLVPSSLDGQPPEYDKKRSLVIDGLIAAVLDNRRTSEELRESSFLMEEIFRGTSFPFANMDTDLKVVRVNMAFAKSYGKPPDFFPGKGFLELFPDDPLHPRLLRLVETGEPFSCRDATFGPAGFMDNTSEYWDIESFPIRGVDGRISGLIISFLNRTRRHNAIREAERTRQELRNLASHLLDMREEERTSIAREVHDELGGILTALKMSFSLIRGCPSRGGGECAQSTFSAEELTDKAIGLVQKIALDLRPKILDDFGLVPAIEWLLGDFQKRSKIRCEAAVDIGERTLSKPKATAVFRILQETLTNVVRHSRASRVRVRLAVDGKALALEIADNGIGISGEQREAPQSLGLIGMHERARSFGGEFSIEGKPQRGTTVRLRMPLSGEELGHA